MKIKLGLALLTLPVSASFALTSSERETLIEALVQVESRGIASAIGDNGRAFGILQIHKVMVNDFNRISGKNYKHNDMFDKNLSLETAKTVLSYYAKHIEKTTGRKATDKELAFIWNGGGSSWRRVASPVSDTKQRNLESYWAKVCKNLN